MSLRIWLPLNGSLENKGLDDIIVTNNGATIDNNGKIGKCYSFVNGYLNLPSSLMSNFKECSICFWININSWNTSYETYFHAGKNSYSWTDYIFGILRNAANSTVCFTIGNGSTASNNNYLTSAWSVGEWMHVAFIYSTGKCKIYLNGNIDKEYDTSIVPDFTKITKITIGHSNGSAYQTNCKMNDFRIYDHALSPLEVKEISKGLILHYLLNRNGLGPTNLLKNGFGELGIENWSYAAGMFSDVPENHPEIYHSYKNVESKEFIPIYRNHNYKFSTWIKTAASSGNSYPSICPYDADKHFIATNNCKEGFDLKTMTILTRELKAGDTKIYVEDLSKWNTNSGHYYDTAAIFGYKDGTGYVWPDGTYTRNCPAFSSGTEAKTNLDKINNIITLLTAYNGVTIPIGTKVCASTYGNTYFYPCGGIPYSTITNWTFKENTFSSETPRLSAAKYIRVLTYSNCYQAGITVTDLTMESFNNNVEYDCSGFGNNGTRTGTFSWTSDTPKYNVSQVFNGVNNAIQTPNLSTMVTDKNYTIACWTYKTVIGTKNYQTIYGGPGGFELEARNSSSTSPLYRIHNWGGGTTAYNFGEWTHFCFVHTDLDSKLYVNGELKITGTSTNIPSGDYFVGAWKTSTQQNFEGLMSDFRIYATALSADDVKSLYQNSAYIDNQGNIYGAVYEEV